MYFGDRRVSPEEMAEHDMFMREIVAATQKRIAADLEFKHEILKEINFQIKLKLGAVRQLHDQLGIPIPQHVDLNCCSYPEKLSDRWRSLKWRLQDRNEFILGIKEAEHQLWIGENCF